MNEIHTAVNCQATGCERLHVGDLVRVVLGPQLGYNELGTVIALSASGFTVHFTDDVVDVRSGHLFNDLTYSESELERMSA